MFDFGIIGGGASGMYASILLAKQGHSVAIFESNDRVGKKILATGNGKCNLSNVDMSADFYNTDSVADIISKFDLVSEFKKLGLITKVKSGRIYPFSEQASSVLNILRANMEKFGVKVFCNAKVVSISTDKDVKITTNNGDFLCKNVCLATGSSAIFGIDSTKLFEKFGHKAENRKPALAPLIALKPEQIKGLSGVRQEAFVTLKSGDKIIASEFGEVQFRKDGISGIVIMNLSSKMVWNKLSKATCHLDFMPTYTIDEVDKFLANKIMAENGLLNKNIMQNALKMRAKGIKDYQIDVKVCDDLSMAQVAHGGLLLDEFDIKSMRSKLNNKLYAIGEALNVDGLCGGYNLHWAFASAYIFAEGVKNVTKTK